MKLKDQALKRPKMDLRTLIVVLLAVSLLGFFLIKSFAASNPIIYLSPSSQTYNTGTTFTVQIRENSASTPVNAVQANFSYPTNMLTFVSLDTSGTAFTTMGPSGDSNGVVSVVGGVIGQVTGDQLVATVTFKANSTEGMAALSFTSETALIDAVTNKDLVGSVSNTAGANYTIKSTPVPTDSIPPSTPTGLRATAVGSTQVDLTWNASTDNVGVASYVITRNAFATNTTSSTTFSDTGLQPNRTYIYHVRAKDSAGNQSPPSTPIYVTTTGFNDLTSPSAPTGLTGSINSSSQVNLSWNVSTDNVGVTGYNIVRNGIKIATSTGTTFTDGSVQANTTYSYAVSAYDSAGNTSPQSPSFTITTPSIATGSIRISGTVYSSRYGGTPVKGATLNLARGTTGTATSTTTSDSFGNYAFVVNAIGPYTFKVSASGYGTQTSTLYISSNRTVNFYMTGQ